MNLLQELHAIEDLHTAIKLHVSNFQKDMHSNVDEEKRLAHDQEASHDEEKHMNFLVMCETMLQRKKDALVAAAHTHLTEVDEETRRLIATDFRTAAGVLAATRLFKHGQMRKHAVSKDGGDGSVGASKDDKSQKDLDFVTELIKRTVTYIGEHQLHLHEFDLEDLPSFVREADLKKLAGDSPAFFDLDMNKADR